MIYATRSSFDLLYSVKELARGMSAPRQGDLVAAIRLAKHLWFAKNVAVKMTMSQEAKAKTGWKPGIRREAKEIPGAAQWQPIVASCDADWASSTMNSRSTSGYLFAGAAWR